MMTSGMWDAMDLDFSIYHDGGNDRSSTKGSPREGVREKGVAGQGKPACLLDEATEVHVKGKVFAGV